MNKKPLVSIIVVTRNREKELIECVTSLLRSTYLNKELIIIDNGSKVPVAKLLDHFQKKITIVREKKNMGAAGGRNVGLKHSHGDYILFMDDDAVADKKMIDELVRAFNKKLHAGVVQPQIFDIDDPTKLQGAGHAISLWSGRVTAWGAGEQNEGQYDKVRNIPLAGCIWMIKREVYEKIGGYDEEYFIPYEDSDFSMRARKAGFKIYCVGSAHAWHHGKKTTATHPWVEWIGITSPERAYRIARNKIIFVRKNGSFFQFIVFLVVFFPLYTILHTILIAFSRQFAMLNNYWKGICSGVAYSFTFK